MTIHQAQQQLTSDLSSIYDAREAANITDWVLEALTGWRKIDRLVHKQDALDSTQSAQLEQYTSALLQHTPVQYVLQEAWFYGMKFYVDEQVLIPRPETEELVEWVVLENSGHGPAILDIGTGSGCIPIALKKNISEAVVYGCDISKGALAVAERNANYQHTDIQWLHLDILDPQQYHRLPVVNVIVSNPPYIPRSDQATMQDNVTKFEPHLALFVENDDPLLFYKAIADLAQEKLLPGGSVFVEIHENLGEATQKLFLDKGFTSAEIKKDMQGKERMIRCSK